MKEQTLAVLCQYLAEQSYMNNLLVEKLIDAGILRQGELAQMYDADPQRRGAFFRDFLARMADLGLTAE